MRVVFTALFLCLVFCTVHASQDRPLRQNYTISIEVECLDAATEIIRALPGYNLDSSANASIWHRTAQFRRRVHSDTLRQVQHTLRGLGEVIHESENAQHLGTSIMDLDVRIAAADQELARLTALMEASTTLEVLIAVNDRIGTVARNRDSMIGRLNVLMVESQGPVVNIELIQLLPGRPAPPPEGFGARIRESFGSSFRNSRNAVANFIVGMVRIFLPLMIWIVIIATALSAVWLLVVRRFWRYIRRKLADENAPQSSPSTLDDVKEEPPCEENM